MLLDRIDGNYSKRSLTDHACVVAPSYDAGICDTFQQEIIRPKAFGLLAFVLRPCGFSIAREAVNEDYTFATRVSMALMVCGIYQ